MHLELEIGVLGVSGKLIKYVVHLWRPKLMFHLQKFLFLEAAQTTNDLLLSGVNVRGD
jgi:hypothetical protein